MKRFCFNSGFPFFWYRRIVRRTIVNQIRCCVPGSARLFLLKLEHLAQSCHLCRSHCLHYGHTMEHLTLQLDVMSTLAKQCNNVLPGLVSQLWILAVFLSDLICDLCDNKIIALFAAGEHSENKLWKRTESWCTLCPTHISHFHWRLL